MRAVSLSEIPGEWSEPIGPVWVPDVRIPPAPNFVRATANMPRTLTLEWTQAGR
jgi:hypothetical protein